MKQWLDRPENLRVIFHPRREEAGASATIQPVRIPVAPGVVLGGRLAVAAPEAPLILFFHGNGEVAADYDGLIDSYLGMGISFLTVDYRGYGVSDGRPTATALIHDAVAAAVHLPLLLAGRGLKPARIYVMGRSLGSAAAIAVAEQGGGQLAGLILESGFADTLPLVERLRGYPLDDEEIDCWDESRDGFGNVDAIGQITLPLLVIHGEEDWIIPASNGRQLYQLAPSQRKRLLLIADAGHNDLLRVDPRSYFKAIQQFIFE